MVPLLPSLALVALLQQPAPPPADTTLPDLVECTGRCPEGVTAPRFTAFPSSFVFSASAAGVDLGDRRSRTFLLFQGVINTDGILETETVQATGGTARGVEAEIRRGLAQARFAPAMRGAVPVRAHVTMRFEFEAEGTSWVKYTYRVTAR